MYKEKISEIRDETNKWVTLVKNVVWLLGSLSVLFAGTIGIYNNRKFAATLSSNSFQITASTLTFFIVAIMGLTILSLFWLTRRLLRKHKEIQKANHERQIISDCVTEWREEFGESITFRELSGRVSDQIPRDALEETLNNNACFSIVHTEAAGRNIDYATVSLK